MQVKVIKNGKPVPRSVHGLITSTFPNVCKRNQIHHINGNSTDNRPCNLVRVFGGDLGKEHNQLHSLMKSNQKEYKKMIKQIRKENSQKLYQIPHLDFEDDDMFNYFMYVTAKGYKAYKAGQEVPLDTIIRESAEVKRAGD